MHIDGNPRLLLPPSKLVPTADTSRSSDAYFRPVLLGIAYRKGRVFCQSLVTKANQKDKRIGRNMEGLVPGYSFKCIISGLFNPNWLFGLFFRPCLLGLLAPGVNNPQRVGQNQPVAPEDKSAGWSPINTPLICQTIAMLKKTSLLNLSFLGL